MLLCSDSSKLYYLTMLYRIVGDRLRIKISLMNLNFVVVVVV